MQRLLLVITFILNSFVQSAGACTIFRSPFAGDTQTAHNVDWYDVFPNVKALIVQNAAKMHKIAFLAGAPMKAAEWTSIYKSLTYSIAGAEFPVSGFNEKGLFMAILVMPNTVYPAADDSRPAVSVTQFVQYNLDMSTTIEDVILSGDTIRPYSKSLKMHYFVCDRTARCAVIQYINGQMSSYMGSDLPYDVLTNSPYPESVMAAQTCNPSKCAQPDTSLLRFGQAAYELVQLYNEPVKFTDGAFKILNDVRQVTGVSTRYQLTYDPLNSSMNFRKIGQAGFSTVKVDFSKVTCNVTRRVIPIDMPVEGDVSNSWQDLTEAYQTELALGTGLPQATAEQAGHYPLTTDCK